MSICSIEGCDRKRESAQGWCSKHWKCWKRNGSPEVVIREQHRLHSIPEYPVWTMMKRRCLNPDVDKYPFYGGRGVRVCREWISSFTSFIDDMGRRPGSDYSLDRIDNDGNYSCGKCEECIANGWPANCKWSTRQEQMNNRRSNIVLDWYGEKMNLTQICRKMNLDEVGYQRAKQRLKRGWTVESAVNTPSLENIGQPH